MLSMEKLRGHIRKGATASLGIKKVVAMSLGYLACRKKLEWLIGGSVEGLEFVRLGTWSSPSEGDWMEVEGLVSDSGWIGRKKQVRWLSGNPERK